MPFQPLTVPCSAGRVPWRWPLSATGWSIALIFGLALVPFFLGWPEGAIPADTWSPDAEEASLGW